jgi:hypothetical protein
MDTRASYKSDYIGIELSFPLVEHILCQLHYGVYLFCKLIFWLRGLQARWLHDQLNSVSSNRMSYALRWLCRTLYRGQACPTGRL